MFNSFSFITNKTSKSSLIKYLFRLLLFVFVSLILFSRVVNAGISHDEYQFVASSQVLVSNGELPYLDYPFLHMPYQILLNSLAVLVSSYHLLTTRCLNAVFSLVSTLILFFLVDKLFEGRSPILRNFAGALAVLLFLFDPALISMDGRALNHAFPIMLSLIAFAIFQNGIAKEWPFSNILVCGLLVGLATGTRLSFAVLAVPFLLILLFYPHHQSVLKRIQSISTFLAGLFIAMLPIVFLIIKAPAQFYFGNYVYIRLNTVYRQEVMFQDSMTPIAKIAYFYGNILANPVSFLMYLGMVIISLYIFISLI